MKRRKEQNSKIIKVIKKKSKVKKYTFERTFCKKKKGNPLPKHRTTEGQKNVKAKIHKQIEEN